MTKAKAMVVAVGMMMLTSMNHCRMISYFC